MRFLKPFTLDQKKNIKFQNIKRASILSQNYSHQFEPMSELGIQSKEGKI